MSKTLEAIIEDAIDTLKVDYEGYLDSDEPHDAIHEIADGAVPVYHADLLDLVANNYELATNVPELGPAFGGEPTPVNIIAANVFEAVEAALWEAHREIREEREEAEDAEEDKED